MKYKILVVDDDKELVKMLCSYFNMKQYETITATDGMEALNKIKMKPDIILLDINMPRMDMTIIGGFAALSIFDYFNFIFVMERCFFHLKSC
ncbi:response regulator transcription factor [Blautia schinkii]|nr:response regulator transcription factor [Blautia schinkii]